MFRSFGPAHPRSPLSRKSKFSEAGRCILSEIDDLLGSRADHRPRNIYREVAEVAAFMIELVNIDSSVMRYRQLKEYTQ